MKMMSAMTFKKSMALYFILSLVSLSAEEENNPSFQEIETELPSLEPEKKPSPPPNPSFRITFEPLYRAKLSAQINVPAKQIYFRMGEHFDKDQVLIQLDDVFYRASYEKAKAELERSEALLETKKNLYRENIASYLELMAAEAEVAKAKAELTSAIKILEATKLSVPFPGKVVALYIEEEELTQAGKEIIEVVNDDVLKARFLIPSKLINQISIGMPVTIKVNETNETVEGKIRRIGAVIDPSSATLQVEAEVDNWKGDLKGGMTGRVTLDINQFSKKKESRLGN